MKKILIAFALATLLFSCTAEGVFSGNSIDNPRVDWSNNDAPSSSSSSPIDDYGSAAVIDRQTCQNRDAHIYE
ncbi:hypothetical protein R83H12_03072 [Fibrobacteria bacterium R8-3-H12]